jgi:gas vesicle protein
MSNGFIKGVTTGAILGAAIGVMVMPQLDRRTRKKIKRSGAMIRHMAGDVYESMMHLNR